MPVCSGQNGEGLVLVPQQPLLRTIIVGDYSCNKHEFRLLHFPYSIFCIFYRKNGNKFELVRCHVPFSNTPFTGKEDDYLYGLPLMNHESAHGICFYNWPVASSLNELIKMVIAQYWASPFMEYNDGFSYWTLKYKGSRFLNNWIKNTKEGNFNWLSEQKLLQSDYIVNIKKLLETYSSQYSKFGFEVVNLEKPVIAL